LYVGISISTKKFISSKQAPFTPKILEISHIKTPNGQSSKPQRVQPTTTKANTKRFIRHVKHSSLPDSQGVLTEMKNKENKSKLRLIGEENAKRIPICVSAVSSRVQSPQDSMCKEAPAKEVKKWKLVGNTNSNDTSRITKEVKTQKIKETSNKCKNMPRKVVGLKSNRPLNTLVSNMRIMSPTQSQHVKNPKKVLSAMSSPIPDESQSFIKTSTSRIISPHVECKKMEHKQRRGTKKSNTLLRTIRSQPASPEYSLYKMQKSAIPTKRLNKIEEAKENLIKWMKECNF